MSIPFLPTISPALGRGFKLNKPNQMPHCQEPTSLAGGILGVELGRDVGKGAVDRRRKPIQRRNRS